MVLAAGAEPPRETALAILAYARERLAPYKRIRRLEFADLPKTISGKIRRVELREQETDRLGLPPRAASRARRHRVLGGRLPRTLSDHGVTGFGSNAGVMPTEQRAVRPGRGDQLPAFSLRQPPARLLAMICRNMAARAGALMASPCLTATVRAVELLWPAVMIPSGSGTMAPS